MHTLLSSNKVCLTVHYGVLATQLMCLHCQSKLCSQYQFEQSRPFPVVQLPAGIDLLEATEETVKPVVLPVKSASNLPVVIPVIL